MKSFKTLNIKQVSAIHSRRLSNNLSIHGVGLFNLTCVLYCICTTTIQHNKPLMWSETLVSLTLQDWSQTSRIWFWSWSWSGRLCSWSWACYAGLGLIIIIIIIIIHEFHRDASLETKLHGRYVSRITLQL